MENYDENEGYTMHGEKVVISGISGRFPNSNNLRELSHNLYNKVDMVDDVESRWKDFHPEVPPRSGKINNLHKFDASFFSIHNRLAHITDPQARILLEHCYEAILDAGVSPQSLIGSRTGVFIGVSNSDSKDMFIFKVPTKDGNGITGNANFYLANRVSFALGLCGPSFIVDTACSSSAYALDLAFKCLQDGSCDAALVGGTQLSLNITTTTEFKRGRILAADGICRPFDKEATGFSRSDTIGVLFLQKLKDSKRIYAHVLTINTNNDGFKLEGTSFPSRYRQQQLFEECFAKLKINPNLIDYVEAHSTGTIIGDSEEVSAIDGAFCKDRQKPLIIGSVKSNLGHTEAASAIASIAKVVLTFENQIIPPNINLRELRDDISAFAEGRIRVPIEPESFLGQFIALNSFGLGGANAQAIFKGNSKSKINNGIPNDKLHRLICWAGRTEEAIDSILDDVLSRPLDVEHIALLQSSQVMTSSSNIYRGFGIFESNGKENAKCIHRNVQHFNTAKRPNVWVYSGIGSQWVGMGKDLMKIPRFAESIEICHNILIPKDINIKEIISSADKRIFENILNSYVGITAIEIALTDVLKSLGLQPDYIIGHSVGEICCAYCDGCLTIEEAMLVAHARGSSNENTKVILGGMAAIGLNHKEVLKLIPKDIDIACHNSNDSTTISGPKKSIECFVEELSSKNIFAKEIECSGVPLHSRYIKEMGANFYKQLTKIIRHQKRRSTKWLSSTYPMDEWGKEEAQYSGVKYHTNNLLHPVYFQEVLEQLPEDIISIEIAPHGLLKPLLKRSFKNGTHFNLTQRNETNGCDYLMNILGQIFQNGMDFDASKLYPPVEFPVSRGTPMIAPVIKWNHSEDFMVAIMKTFDWFDKRSVLINISDKDYEHIQGHVIDGKFLFPGTGLIFLVWETFSMMNGCKQENFSVIFEEVKFLRATNLTKNQDIILTISIHKASGMFEVTEGQSAVAIGVVKANEDPEMSRFTPPDYDDNFTLLENDFYKEMRLRGYNHHGLFRAIRESRNDGLRGKIQWNNDWMTFIDCLLQFKVLKNESRMLVLPTKFRKLIINPFIHHEIISKSSDKLIDVMTCPYSNIIQAGGVEIHDFEGSTVNRRRPQADPILESYKFIPHISSNSFLISDMDAVKFCTQILLENAAVTKIVSVEIDAKDDKDPLSECIHEAISNVPMVTSTTNYLTSRKLSIDNVNVVHNDLWEFENVHLIVKSECLDDNEFLKSAKAAIGFDGFIISRESRNKKLPFKTSSNHIDVIATLFTEHELIVLAKFAKDEYNQPDKAIKITSDNDDWLEPLKYALKNYSSVIVYSEHEKHSGIIGLTNCIRKELSNPSSLRCFAIEDSTAPPFDMNHPFYEQQIKLGLSINVYKDSQWGSYRHLQLQITNEIIPREGHFQVICTMKGDLSTLSWVKGKHTLSKIKQSQQSVRIKCSALNFRDVMIASGKIHFDFVDRIEWQNIIGHEFAGVTNDGRRVVGFCNLGGIATYFSDPNCLLWEIPDSWSFEEAVTTPLVYSTVFLAFFSSAAIKQGESILIHAGSGGVGIAAIHVALHYGLEVYTTVSSKEKRDFLLNEFPSLKLENIGNSRDTSFEHMIAKNTKGCGVNYVLNSLSDDKLLASLRCLAENGTFLEIGKFDIMNKTKIDLGFLAKNIKIKPVFIKAHGKEVDANMKTVYKFFKDSMEKGIVKPLKQTVFEASDIQNAFRYLATGKHIGKVVIKIRENDESQLSLPIPAVPRVYCQKNLSYIIVGGLGGFGLEFADWLVLRNCKKLILTSTKGITNGYQASRIRTWQGYGVQVCVSTADVTTKNGCEDLIRLASDFGSVGGIFNLAVVLRDAMFENQNAKLFKESFDPKAIATRHLDEVSRELCPDLQHFVVFSSVSCGRGNAGQSNYGMANAIMERIIEKRHRLKLPAKAIQWGAVGDVGLLADLIDKNLDMQISGTLPQKITSCLEVLDVLLESDEPIVESMVVAEKKFSEIGKGNIIEMLLNILGIRDKKSVSMDASLSKIGLDSLMSVEISQLLEREFNIFLSLKELQMMSLHELEQRTKPNRRNVNDSNSMIDSLKASPQSGLQMLLSNIGKERKSDDTILQLKSISNGSKVKALIVPGIEGMSADVWEKLAEKLNFDTYILQLHKSFDSSSIKGICNHITEDVLKFYADSNEFLLIGYSFGTLLSLEIAKILEMNSKSGSIVMVDGSPTFFKRFTKFLGHSDTNDASIQREILTSLIHMEFPDNHEDIASEVFSKPDLNTKLESFINLYETMHNFKRKKKYSKEWIIALFKRFKMVQALNENSFPTLESSRMSLVVPSEKLFNDISINYDLNLYTLNDIQTLVIDGNHVSILHNLELPKFLNCLK
ncbi:CLUMA_CG015087, isoform A [Clunio marinus]|uniref:Fatty acid synthase n=1 Tax=Clunio marinus TaxID=568069 RepID=A0A1J1IRA4_9DIPT|nr:CLUMA_CG015087, isoform A [Clunio marinus]